MRIKLCAAAASAAAFLWGCLERPVEPAQNGGGSEAVAMVGAFTNPDGSPAAGISVRLRPKLFLAEIAGGSEVIALAPGTIRDAITDAAGIARIDSVRRGEYLLEVLDSAGRGLLLPAVVTGDRDTLALPPAILKPTGDVTGTFVPPDGFAGRTWVQIYGLERSVPADSATGRFRMEGLPEGSYKLRAVYSAPAVDPREIDSVDAVPEETVDIGAIRLASFENENYAAWPHSRRLYLNTTSAGAGVAGNVDDFPVLVRLTQADFDFSQAGSGGSDIRFSDAKGKRLRYEIERWDSAGARAEIWVRVDRVLGNSSSQFINLHWGAPVGEGFSDGRPVFAADAGFAGTWHLAEGAPDTLSNDLYKDASGYNPASDRTASEIRSGVIDGGAGFDGGDYIGVPVADPLLQPNSAVTASAWMRASRTGPAGGTLLSMGDTYTLRVTPSGSLRFQVYTGEFAAVETPKGVNLLDSAWHHVAGSYDGSTLAVYVDGRLSAKAAARGALDYRFWPGFVLGRHGNRKAGYEFIGSLDQVEISGERARPADWLKLAFENQREGSLLVEFRP